MTRFEKSLLAVGFLALVFSFTGWHATTASFSEPDTEPFAPALTLHLDESIYPNFSPLLDTFQQQGTDSVAT